MDSARAAFKGFERMCTMAYVAVLYVVDTTTLNLKDPRRLCTLPERLSAHAWPWNPEEPATTEA